jgi:ethanolamine utilization protein EutQ (cupin superfamily)
MKIIITENQYKLIKENVSLKEKLLSLIKKVGFESTIRVVGSLDKTFEIFDIKEPMDFLNLFNDLDVVQSEEEPNWVLYRYKKGHNFMIYDRKIKYVFINYDEIWTILEDNFDINFGDITTLVETWLDEVYDLKGITTYNHIVGIHNTTI